MWHAIRVEHDPETLRRIEDKLDKLLLVLAKLEPFIDKFISKAKTAKRLW